MILTACKGKYNESTISPSLDLRKGITICEAPKEAIDKVYIVDSTICILYDRSMHDYAHEESVKYIRWIGLMRLTSQLSSAFFRR